MAAKKGASLAGENGPGWGLRYGVQCGEKGDCVLAREKKDRQSRYSNGPGNLEGQDDSQLSSGHLATSVALRQLLQLPFRGCSQQPEFLKQGCMSSKIRLKIQEYCGNAPP